MHLIEIILLVRVEVQVQAVSRASRTSANFVSTQGDLFSRLFGGTFGGHASFLGVPTEF